MSIRPIALAAVLALGALQAQAGSIAYNFVEGGAFAPHPGMIGATLTFDVPPASPDSGWTASAPDVLSFIILDSAIAPVGSYTVTGGYAVSLTGAMLDAGVIQASTGGITIATIPSSAPGVSFVEITAGGQGGSNGDWLLANASVPEPSSLVMAGIAALAGMRVWMRRRRPPV
jgi:hypothetical protein